MAWETVPSRGDTSCFKYDVDPTQFSTHRHRQTQKRENPPFNTELMQRCWPPLSDAGFTCALGLVTGAHQVFLPCCSHGGVPSFFFAPKAAGWPSPPRPAGDCAGDDLEGIQAVPPIEGSLALLSQCGIHTQRTKRRSLGMWQPSARRGGE